MTNPSAESDNFLQKHPKAESNTNPTNPSAQKPKGGYSYNTKI